MLIFVFLPHCCFSKLFQISACDLYPLCLKLEGENKVLVEVLNWRLPSLNHNNLQCIRLTDEASNCFFFQSNKVPPAFTAGKCEIWLKVSQGHAKLLSWISKALWVLQSFPFAWGKSEWVKHLVSSKLWFWRPPGCPCLILHCMLRSVATDLVSIRPVSSA